MLFTLSGPSSGRKKRPQSVAMQWQDVTIVMACTYKTLSDCKAKLDPITDAFTVSTPFIVNAQEIDNGKEAVENMAKYLEGREDRETK